MKMHLFSVYDSKAKTYCNPFVHVNIATALRDFSHAANDPLSELYRSPTDYTLFHLGTIDLDDASIQSQIPAPLGMADAFKKQPQALEVPENV